MDEQAKRNLSSALLNNQIIKEKNGYYFIDRGQKVNLTESDLIYAYKKMELFLQIEEKDLQKEEISNNEVLEAIGGHITVIQALEKNILKKNFDRLLKEHLQRLKEIVRENGYEELLEKILEETRYEPEMLIKLYKFGLMDEGLYLAKTKLLYEVGMISEVEIIKMLDTPEFSEYIYAFLGEEKLLELYEKNKSIKYINYLPIEAIVFLYQSNKLNEKDLEKSYFNKDSVIKLFRNGAQPEDIYQFLQRNITSNFIPNADDFINLLRDRVIFSNEFKKFIVIAKGNNQISDKLIKCQQDGYFNNREMLEFAQKSMVEDDLLIELHKMQQMVKSAIIIPNAFENEFINDKEFREYFDVNKLLEWKKQGKLNQEFFEFYLQILPKEEQEQLQWEKGVVEELKEKEDSTENMLLFYKAGILHIETIKQELNEEKIIENSEKIDNNIILSLYNEDVLSIEALAIIYENRTDEIALACRENKLNETALELMSQEEIAKFYQTEQLSDKNMIKAYQYGILPIEVLKELKIKVNEEENVFDETFEAEQIKELFLNRFIDYDKLLQLQKNGIITQKEFIQINKEFDFEAAIAELKNRGDIANEALPQGNGPTIKGKYSKINLDEGMKRKLPNISVESREEYFRVLKTEEPKTIYGSSKLSQKAALEGYNYIIAKKLGVVILEKFYEDNTDNCYIPAVENATYILPPVKLIEYLEKSNKQDLRQDKNVRYVNHTANWGRNLLKACSEVNPELDKKELMKQYKEFNDLLRQEYEENIENFEK